MKEQVVVDKCSKCNTPIFNNESYYDGNNYGLLCVECGIDVAQYNRSIAYECGSKEAQAEIFLYNYSTTILNKEYDRLRKLDENVKKLIFNKKLAAKNTEIKSEEWKIYIREIIELENLDK